MRISILTTDTSHHTYFVKELINSGLDVTVFCEKKKEVEFSNLLSQSFESNKKQFEQKQEKYEANKWFNGENVKLGEICKLIFLDDINSTSSIELIEKSNPNLIIVFGTGKIKNNLINIFRDNIYNLHGGDPQKYRGLDSLLWAIYHKDYNSLKTTLHRISPDLDKGDIFRIDKINFWSNMDLYQLRSSNTELCLQLSMELINEYKKHQIIKCFKQKSIGRYYSLMPESLKFRVSKNFKNFILKNFG